MLVRITGFFLLMFLLSCLGQLSSDIYLPALPLISHDLTTPIHQVQRSISIYFFGFAISNLVYGPLSDSLGRKKPLLIGLVITLIGALICFFSTSIVGLDMGRFIQGLGTGAAATIYPSILSDLYHGNRLAKVSTMLDVSRIFLLASSPLIGSILLHFFSWRACFVFLLIYTAIALLGSSLGLKETNQHQHLHPLAFKHLSRNLRIVIVSPTFLCYTALVMLTFGGILCWLTTLPVVLQTAVGLTPLQFGLTAAVAGLFFIVGGVCNALFVEKLGIDRMLTIGLSIMLLGGLSMLGLGLLGYLNYTVIMVPVFIFITGSSMIFSNAYAGAFKPFKALAGSASALFSALQILGGAISSFIMSFPHTYNQVPLASALIALSAVGLILLAIRRFYDRA